VRGWVATRRSSSPARGVCNAGLASELASPAPFLHRESRAAVLATEYGHSHWTTRMTIVALRTLLRHAALLASLLLAAAPRVRAQSGAAQPKATIEELTAQWASLELPLLGVSNLTDLQRDAIELLEEKYAKATSRLTKQHATIRTRSGKKRFKRFEVRRFRRWKIPRLTSASPPLFPLITFQIWTAS